MALEVPPWIQKNVFMMRKLRSSMESQLVAKKRVPRELSEAGLSTGFVTCRQPHRQEQTKWKPAYQQQQEKLLLQKQWQKQRQQHQVVAQHRWHRLQTGNVF